MRTSRAARLLLGVVALLTVAGAFGLHPEPASAALQTPSSGFSAGQTVPPPHDCLACLSHGAALVSPVRAIVPDAACAAPAPAPGDAAHGGRPAGRDLSGRSPPARS